MPYNIICISVTLISVWRFIAHSILYYADGYFIGQFSPKLIHCIGFERFLKKKSNLLRNDTIIYLAVILFQYEWSHRAKRREIIKHMQAALENSSDQEFDDEELEKLLVRLFDVFCTSHKS